MKVNERRIIRIFHGFLLLLPIVLFFVYALSLFRSNTSINDIFSNYSSFISSNLTFDVFNFNNIISWLETNIFNSNMPYIFNIVCYHLIYYVLVEILILLFDVIFFVVHFARKWVGGFYA